MTQHRKPAEKKQHKKRPRARVTVAKSEPAQAREDSQIGLAKVANGLDSTGAGPNGAAHLSERRMQLAQRRDLAAQMGETRGNRYLQRVAASSKQEDNDTESIANQPTTVTGRTSHHVQRGLFSWVKKAASAVWGGIKGVAKGTWNAVKRAGSFAVSVAKRLGKGAASLIARFGERIVGFLNRWGSRAVAWVKRFGSRVVGWVSRWGSQVIGWISRWGTRVINWLSKWGSQVVAWIKKWGLRVINFISYLGVQLWHKVVGIYHRILGWTRMLPARLGRLLLHLWEGVRSLKPWSLDWWLSLGKASTWMGLLKWLGTGLIQFLEIAGVGEVYETLMDFVKFNTRLLTSEEISKAQVVFGGVINYSLVRVDEHAVIGPSWTNRAYVSFHIINAWGNLDNHTLIHELTHVWQYQRMGAIYMPKALHAQQAGGYVYGGLEGLRQVKEEGGNLMNFNLEQQGDILADYYIYKTGDGLDKADLEVYEHFAADVRR